MSRSEDISIFKPERLDVGVSQVVGVTLVAGQISIILKYFSGGSLEVIDPLAQGGQTVLGGSGYMLATSEALNSSMIGTFYLTATGSTATAMLLRGKTIGT